MSYIQKAASLAGALKSILLIALGSSLIACSTVNFVQIEQEGKQVERSKWHHIVLNGMVEVSPPLDVRKVCGDKAWNRITTEFTFYNWLATAATPSIPYLSPYTPWTNTIECYEPVVPPLKPEPDQSL